MRFLFVLVAVFFATSQAQSITYITGNRTSEVNFAKEMATAYMEDHPGVEIVVLQGPASTTDRAQQYLQFFEAQSSEIDIYEIDVIWPGDMAEHFVDLYNFEGYQADSDAFFQAIIENNTVAGALAAVPYYTDAGLLYYRTDLLDKYGLTVPETWDELESAAQTIQEGERDEGNPDFWGFVWQGDAYEGLTCNALEWISSFGGGDVVSSDNRVTIENEDALDAVSTAASWVGTISPPGVTGFQEEDSRNVWHAGNAAFMRNWPYVYSLTLEGDIGEKFAIAALPHAEGQSSAATLGGWQLAVSKYSENPEVAANFVRYLTSTEGQLKRAIEGILNFVFNGISQDKAEEGDARWRRQNHASMPRYSMTFYEESTANAISPGYCGS